MAESLGGTQREKAGSFTPFTVLRPAVFLMAGIPSNIRTYETRSLLATEKQKKHYLERAAIVEGLQEHSRTS